MPGRKKTSQWLLLAPWLGVEKELSFLAHIAFQKLEAVFFQLGIEVLDKALVCPVQSFLNHLPLWRGL